MTVVETLKHCMLIYPSIFPNKWEVYHHICATHDFCDPNQSMIDAFKSITGREPDVQSDEDNLYINTSWSLAKANEFNPIHV